MTINIKGYNVLIDDEDFELISSKKWSMRKRNDDKVYFYTHSHFVGDLQKHISMHRFIMGMRDGDGMVIDHISGNTLDNRKNNLRICKQSNNTMNRKRGKNNTSGYKGVSWSKSMGKWQVQIAVNHKSYHLGYFNCPTVAWISYVRKAVEFYGDYARFN